MKKKRTSEGIEYYAFVENPKPLPENFSLCDGNITSWLKKRYTSPNNFGVDYLKRDGQYREGGWLFDLRPYLKKYIVKKTCNVLYLAYAPSVYDLRKADNLKASTKIAVAPFNF